jgi:hypothetical protein
MTKVEAEILSIRFQVPRARAGTTNLRGVNLMHAPSSGVRLVASVIAALAATAAGAATTLTVESGPAGSVTLDSSTAGTNGDPWLMTESVGAVAPVVVRLDNPDTNPVGPDNSTGSGHAFGKWFSKTVTNNTSDVWTSFDLELQSELGVPSVDGDGLSFAQGASLVVSSDKFSNVHRVEDVRDFLNFDGGSVGIGESVTFLFAITDNGDRNTFWLSETANRVVGNVPEPETYALMLAGLGAMGWMARRRKAA